MPASYSLLYHPGIPGRAEFVRLALEAAGVPYADVANQDRAQYAHIQALCGPEATADEANNPPPFAPPALRVHGAKPGGADLLIYQTPNILLYLGPKLGLVGDDEHDLYYVNELALTALDLNNEAHDTHHPLAVMQYYEDQKEAALAKATDFRRTRIPKYLSLLERSLRSNETTGRGKHLVSGKLTYADTTWWQVVDGLTFAFPNEISARRSEFPLIFDTFYPGLKSDRWLQDYLASERRLKYSMGVFRHYPELDRQ